MAKDERVYCRLTITSDTQQWKMASVTFDPNNLCAKIKGWLNLYGYHVTFNEVFGDVDEIPVYDKDGNRVASLNVSYPQLISVFDSLDRNVLNGNVDWTHALSNDILERKIVSPEYIISRRKISNSIIRCNLPFDMASMLILLYGRGADIIIPQYDRTKELSENSVGTVMEAVNRNGKLIGLVSNASTFNFSIRILDNNVEQNGVRGVPRTFTLTDYYGNLSENWSDLKFTPNSKEFESLKEIFYYTRDVLSFKNFVNSEKAQCFYSEWYYNMKLAIHRLAQEKKYLANLISKYSPVIEPEKTDEGSELMSERKPRAPLPKEESASVEITAFECIVDEPVISFSYVNESQSPELIVEQAKCELEGLSSKLEMYRFITRMVECAWTKLNPIDSFSNPTEIKKYNRADIRWCPELFKFPGKRIAWLKCDLPNGKSLYCRYYAKKVKEKIK